MKHFISFQTVSIIVAILRIVEIFRFIFNDFNYRPCFVSIKYFISISNCVNNCTHEKVSYKYS